MLLRWSMIFCIFLCLGLIGFYTSYSDPLDLSSDLAHQLGLQIWKNECGGKLEGLTTWNKGEEFASLGIGHFIWYPENQKKIFKETFPALLSFFKSRGVSLPLWLDQAKACPWQTRESFQQAQQEEKLVELRQFLAQHVDLQILFMIQRLKRALPTLLKYTPKHQHAHLTFQFYRLAYTPEGVYVLLDYLNFKGEGTHDPTSHQGHGWGLLQVLEQLQGTAPGFPAIQEFVEIAKKVLKIRVEHAPAERQEHRWLPGWYNRLDTYCQFSVKIDHLS